MTLHIENIIKKHESYDQGAVFDEHVYFGIHKTGAFTSCAGAAFGNLFIIFIPNVLRSELRQIITQ